MRGSSSLDLSPGQGHCVASFGKTLKSHSASLHPGAHFLKFPVITGPFKLFCFPFRMGVSKGLKIVQ